MIWQLVVSFTDVAAVTLPSPGLVARSLIDHHAILMADTVVTLAETVYGFAIAAVVGLLVALVLTASKTIEKIVYPLLVISQAVPKVAVAPVFLVWFGFGMQVNVLTAAILAVFPIIVNGVLGFQETSNDYLALGRVMGANKLRLLWRIRLPAAMPSIFAGLKLGITFATVGAVVGEMVAGQEGLGYRVQFSSGQLDTPMVFAALVLLSAAGVALFYVLVGLEKLVVRR
ncbi:ABC transporter permease [Pseudonocardia sp. RS010]|uniref:ABC transporter permease n=1 Tax=Pseudonocardia sp. RS010 TaxID=3385979 RepID=UPI0039A34571